MTELQPFQILSIGYHNISSEKSLLSMLSGSACQDVDPREIPETRGYKQCMLGYASSGKNWRSAVLTLSVSPHSWLSSTHTSKRSQSRKNASVLWYFQLWFQNCVLWDLTFLTLCFDSIEVKKCLIMGLPWERLPIRLLDHEHSWPSTFVYSGKPLLWRKLLLGPRMRPPLVHHGVWEKREAFWKYVSKPTQKNLWCGRKNWIPRGRLFLQGRERDGRGQGVPWTFLSLPLWPWTNPPIRPPLICHLFMQFSGLDQDILAPGVENLKHIPHMLINAVTIHQEILLCRLCWNEWELCKRTAVLWYSCLTFQWSLHGGVFWWFVLYRSFVGLTVPLLMTPKLCHQR